MAVKIRLARGGAKKRPFYRIVVATDTAKRDGRFIERVGSYNPLLKKNSEDRVKISEERVKYWLGEGAVPTDRICEFLSQKNIQVDNKFVKQYLHLKNKSIKRLESKIAEEKKKKDLEEKQQAKKEGEVKDAS